MTDETSNKVVKLTKVVTEKEAKEKTYRECLDLHISKLDARQAGSIPVVMFIGALLEDGTVYSVLAGDDGAQFVGALEILKQYVMLDMLGE